MALTGCETVGQATSTKTGQGAVVGGLLGAGTGAIIGNQTGHPGAGTAIGAGLGALTGGMVGHGMDEMSRGQTAAPASTGNTKFCPVGGEEYGEGIKYCPVHGVELKYKQR
ncbi:MAG: hypothetical protein HY597_00265 [Candidatus Omnitrophica bacterium]|nr:hypothetical protein [Candidatus Omnitrophota bacterium]